MFGLQTGLASEVTALEDTGTALQAMEDDNTDSAGEIEGWV